MIDTEGYVLMDYNGKPVSIENGKKYWWDAEEGQHWNSQTRQFEDDEEEDEDEYENYDECYPSSFDFSSRAKAEYDTWCNGGSLL